MKKILMDVDDTLYPRGTGPFNQVNRLIEEFVMSWCRLDPEGAKGLRKKYISEYGSTLGGLMKHHEVDPEHYLRFVHDVPVEDFLAKDDRLLDVLAGVQHEMVIFSNASADYVRRVLEALGISGCFRDLFTIEFMDYIPKPRAYPYSKAMALYGGRPGDFILVDDRPPNISTALEMGMEAVLVGADDPVQGALMIRDIYEISRVIP